VTIGGDPRGGSKNERREAAREKARQLREQQRKRERRNRVLLFSGIGVAVIAIVAVVAFIIFTSIRPAGPGPANMASDGIKIGQELKAVPTAALPAGADPVPSEANPSNVVDIQVYVDYLCPYCGQFEATNSEQIENYVTDGSATVEIHPIAILNAQSQGTKYSTRAANAAACVANSSPDNFYDFSALLFQNQPEENTAGLGDDEIIDLLGQAGVSNQSDIEKCINDGTFDNWVGDATNRALTGPLPNTEVPKLTGTPLVLVNGAQYTGTLTDASEFAAFVLQQSANPASGSTPTPTPTPSVAG